MPRPALVVMAAGIGSRYGGLKQIDPVGPQGEIVIDYSLYDALRAGFGKVVFLIRREMEEPFREKIGKSIEARVETAYVFQEIAQVPAGFAVPPERQKPWGTGHAVLVCKDVVHTPFAVINADDFYGATAFQVLAQYLRQAEDRPGMYAYGMVGYRLSHTLSAYGYVARGVCQTTPDGYLLDIRERTRIEKFADGARYTENGTDWVSLPDDTIVSMNMWGFTPSIFTELEARFPAFLQQSAANVLKAEYFLPDVVGALLHEHKAGVRVLPTNEKWFGVTYREDRPRVQAAIQALIAQGAYPRDLWNGEAQ